MKRIAFTNEGLSKLKKEFDNLSQKRINAVKELAAARNMGDLSENGAYRANKFKLNSIDNRLRYLNKTINSAYIIEKSPVGIVGIGSYVTFSDSDNKVQTLQIVGSHESDISNNKISCYSPIGKALIGRREQEVVQMITPSGKKEIIIKNIL